MNTETNENEAIVAVTVMTAFQNYLQHAEAKISTLLVAHTGAVLAVMAALPNLPSPGGDSILVLPAVYGAFVLSFLFSGHHLVQALRPRLRTPISPSAFGIMGVSPNLPAGFEAQRDAAWQMVRVFAELAETKHRHVAKAIPGTAAMLTSALLCVAITMALG
ncbi:hypothetical protein AGRA3207_001498 [Actinomadura graeca]|uniref:Pycsar effector protein domain-containing protein n=1 Tax=Actinomadura graeca TaxID=2750812 RepID=A0ABX8QQ25_9ACTN|nr:hypothetical protein [Actinomadura graeca]QXJ20733.1 hypothetical protein AGRA3207_001498 [Actinomadura graeca]